MERRNYIRLAWSTALVTAGTALVAFLTFQAHISNHLKFFPFNCLFFGISMGFIYATCWILVSFIHTEEKKMRLPYVHLPALGVPVAFIMTIAISLHISLSPMFGDFRRIFVVFYANIFMGLSAVAAYLAAYAGLYHLVGWVQKHRKPRQAAPSRKNSGAGPTGSSTASSSSPTA